MAYRDAAWWRDYAYDLRVLADGYEAMAAANAADGNHFGSEVMADAAFELRLAGDAADSAAAALWGGVREAYVIAVRDVDAHLVAAGR